MFAVSRRRWSAALVLAVFLPIGSMVARADDAAVARMVTGDGEPIEGQPSPGPAPSGLPPLELDAAVSLLGASEVQQVVEQLRWRGLAPQHLLGGRESTNLGLPQAVDRWRMPAAEAALYDPMWLPSFAGDRAARLREDLGGPFARWAGVAAIARSELGAAPQDAGCDVFPARSLLKAAEEDPAMTNRRLAYYRQEVDPRIDRIAGRLLAEAREAACLVDTALVRVDRETRTWLAAELDRTLAGGDELDEQARFDRALRLAAAWQDTDRALLVEAGLGWSDAVRQAAIDLSVLPPDAWPGGPLTVYTRFGPVWIGSPGPDVLDGDPLLLLDPGGDDRWGISEAASAAEVLVRPVRGWIDLGGNDLWTGGAVGPGGAMFGVSSGIDAAGDDTWRTGILGQGAAWFGVATWLDGGGSDARVGPSGVQGFAGFGLAALRDTGPGVDTWRAGTWAQAAALTGGLALVHNEQGNDRYVLGGVEEDHPDRLPGHFAASGQGFAQGARPWLGGGVAWLQDDAGHDQYDGGLWVQGSSYWHALGVLVDGGGNDVYISDQYSQGSGIHLSAAGLFDLAGDDRYLTRNLGQGSGHDLAVSWLLDGRGDDLYIGQDTVQGASLTNAVSFFVDRAGSDTYIAGSDKRHGFTGQARGYGSVAVFLDEAGPDNVLSGVVRPPVAASGEASGEAEAEETSVEATPVEAAPVEAAAVEAAAVEAAPVEATAGEHAAPPLVDADAARDETAAEDARALLLATTRWLAPAEQSAEGTRQLFALGPQAVGWVLPLASSEMHLRSYTIQALVERWAAEGRPQDRVAIARALVDSLRDWPTSPYDGAVRWHLRWLGIVLSAEPDAAPDAIVGVDIAREHPAWQARQQAWTLAAQLAEAERLPRILRGTWRDAAIAAVESDPVPEVRAAAARFLGAGGDGDAVRPLQALLLTGGFEQRDAAEQALVALAGRGHGTMIVRALKPLARGEDGVDRDAALRILGATGLSSALDLVRDGLASPDPATRYNAARALVGMDNPAARRLRVIHADNEADPRVLAVLQAG